MGTKFRRARKLHGMLERRTAKRKADPPQSCGSSTSGRIGHVQQHSIEGDTSPAKQEAYYLLLSGPRVVFRSSKLEHVRCFQRGERGRGTVLVKAATLFNRPVTDERPSGAVQAWRPLTIGG
jgi:hypothetical protein